MTPESLPMILSRGLNSSGCDHTVAAMASPFALLGQCSVSIQYCTTATDHLRDDGREGSRIIETLTSALDKSATALAEMGRSLWDFGALALWSNISIASCKRISDLAQVDVPQKNRAGQMVVRGGGGIYIVIWDMKSRSGCRENRTARYVNESLWLTC